MLPKGTVISERVSHNRADSLIDGKSISFSRSKPLPNLSFVNMSVNCIAGFIEALSSFPAPLIVIFILEVG